MRSFCSMALAGTAFLVFASSASAQQTPPDPEDILAPEAAEVVERSVLIGELTPYTGEASAPSVALDIRFEFGSAALAASAQAQLVELAAAMKAPELAQHRFGIYGHTDAVGSAEANLELSRRRAVSVAAFLVEKGGVDAERLETDGLGETQLLYPADPDHARNRRVEIRTLPDSAAPSETPSASVAYTGDAEAGADVR